MIRRRPYPKTIIVCLGYCGSNKMSREVWTQREFDLEGCINQYKKGGIVLCEVNDRPCGARKFDLIPHKEA